MSERTSIVLDADHFERVMGALMTQMETRHEHMLGELRNAVAEGTKAGVEQAVNDTKLMDTFGNAVYDRLAVHTRDDVSRSIGRRVISWAVFALLGAALALSAFGLKK